MTKFLLAGASVLLLFALALPGVATAAPSITEYIAADKGTSGIAEGPNGDTWFTLNENPGYVARVTPLGGMTTYSTANGLTNDAKPASITAGPGGMWFTETGKNKIGRITESGAITEFVLGPVGKPVGITAGPDGNLWYTAIDHDSGIGRLTPSGVATEFGVAAGLTKDSRPQDITRGPDGALWFTEPAANKIGRITTQGVITEYATGAINGSPQEIVAGPDGNLWFTLPADTPAIGRITPQGAVTLFTAGLPLGSAPRGIAAGNDGALHFTDNGANAIGRITTAGVVTMTSAGITASSDLRSITTGSDGAMWFSEFRGALGRVTVAPKAETVTPATVTAATADLTGRAKPNSQATTAYLEWGTTTAYGQTTASVPLGISGSTQTFQASLSGLSPATTYHARVVAQNATGTTYGPNRTFTTPALNAPVATTQAATDLADATAQLNATVNPSGNATTYRFEYGTATLDRQVPLVEPTVGSDAQAHALSQTLTGLAPNTTYQFRVVATSSAGTTAGAVQTFTTDRAAPVVTTNDAAPVATTTATLSALINPRNSSTFHRFEWGRTRAYGQSAPAPDAEVGSDDVAHAVGQSLTGLEPNTTYHFRVVATSEGGTTTGPDQTFTTEAALPLVETDAPSDVGRTKATLHGTTDPRNARTVTWFEYGATPDLGNATGPVALPPASQRHGQHKVLTGLEPGTTYYARLMAASEAGTATGPVVTFTTQPAAIVLVDQPAEPRAETPAPEIGRTVVAEAARGTIKVKLPGKASFGALEGTDGIPSGSVVDATRGAILLESALPGGGTQKATFEGARFRVVQGKASGGYVDISLLERPTGCRPGVARAAAKRRTTPRTLWAKDDHGKYRTRGRHSAATVRGTRWGTTETCRGTVTRVTSGSVAVRDLHTKRTVVVRAGRSYLARAPRR